MCVPKLWIFVCTKPLAHTKKSSKSKKDNFKTKVNWAKPKNKNTQTQPTSKPKPKHLTKEFLARMNNDIKPETSKKSTALKTMQAFSAKIQMPATLKSVKCKK